MVCPPRSDDPAVGLTKARSQGLSGRLEGGCALWLLWLTWATTKTRSTSIPTPTHPLIRCLIGADAALLYDTTSHLAHAHYKSNYLQTVSRTAVATCNDVNVNVDKVGCRSSRGRVNSWGFVGG